MNTKMKQNINVGFDTGKTQLDIHIRPLELFFSVENSQKGIKEALEVINNYNPGRIVIEATGRLEIPFVLACAEAIKPELTVIKAENIRLMSDLVIRRNQLLSMQTMEKNRLQILPVSLHPTIKPLLTTIKNQITKLEEKLVKLIEDSPEYQTKNTILQSVLGIGNIAAASIISNVPELGYITNKQAASLIGVAPITRESGRYKGKRVIQGGRAQVRTVLYMATMSAMQCNPVYKVTYTRLVDAGKPKKVAIIARVRKVVVILNSMLRDGVMWDENAATN